MMENNFILDTNVVFNLSKFAEDIENKDVNGLICKMKQNASETIISKIKMLKSMKKELNFPITSYSLNNQKIKGIKDFFEKYKDNNLIKNLDNIDLSKEPFVNNDYQTILDTFNFDSNKISYVDLYNCHRNFNNYLKDKKDPIIIQNDGKSLTNLRAYTIKLNKYLADYSNFIKTNENVKTIMVANELIKEEKQFYITPTILKEVENHIDNEENSNRVKDHLFPDKDIKTILKSTNFIKTNDKFNNHVKDLKDKLIDGKAVSGKPNSDKLLADATISAEANILGIIPLTFNEQDFTIDKSITNASGQGYCERKMKMINVLINHTDYTTNALPCSVDDFFKSRGVIERKPIRVIAVRNEKGNYEILENSADEKFPNTKEIVLKNESNFERVEVNEKQVSTQRNSFEFKNAYKLKNKQENEIEREM